jgi:hypothetical protein
VVDFLEALNICVRFVDFINTQASLVSRKKRWLEDHGYTCPIARYILFNDAIIEMRASVMIPTIRYVCISCAKLRCNMRRAL